MGVYSSWIKGIWVNQDIDPNRIDYSWLKKQGVEFGFVRAGDSFTVDTKFHLHVQGLYDADMPCILTWRTNPDWPSSTLVMNLDSAMNMRLDQNQEIDTAVRATVTSPKAFAAGVVICDRRYMDEPVNSKKIDPNWIRNFSRVSVKHFGQTWGTNGRKVLIASTDQYINDNADPKGGSMFDWIAQDQLDTIGLNISGYYPSTWETALDIPDTAKPNWLNGNLKFWRYSYSSMPVKSDGTKMAVGLVAFKGTTRDALYSYLGYTSHTPVDPSDDNDDNTDNTDVTLVSKDLESIVSFMDQASDKIINKFGA